MSWLSKLFGRQPNAELQRRRPGPESDAFSRARPAKIGGYVVTASGDDATEIIFALLCKTESLPTRGQVEEKHAALQEAFGADHLYEGNEDDMRRRVAAALQQWLEHPSCKGVHVKSWGDGGVQAYAEVTNDAGGTMIWPAAVYRTSDRFFAFGNRVFRP